MAGQLVVVFRFFDVVRAALLCFACFLALFVCSFVGVSLSSGLVLLLLRDLKREVLCRYDIQNIV